jgi:hypothetical protein
VLLLDSSFLRFFSIVRESEKGSRRNDQNETCRLGLFKKGWGVCPKKFNQMKNRFIQKKRYS